ncbi:zinc finger, C2H2 type [Trichuris suis]|nr:zinc finger, C2H2 type [Trichuris suis]
MPYRTELRRPDLKGTFRCSLCNKIFCHSSSLSRHRMQAHFKSYTCTLCNKEITSTYTLVCAYTYMYISVKISVTLRPCYCEITLVPFCSRDSSGLGYSISRSVRDKQRFNCLTCKVWK